MFTTAHYPTIVQAKNFDPVESAKTLWKAVEGLGTDEDSIINVVSSCNNSQRQQIKAEFLKSFGKDLVKEFKSEIRIRLFFDFSHLLESLFMTPIEFDACCLKASVKGLGTDEKSLVEVLLTRTTEELTRVRSEYVNKYKVPLEEDVADDTSGDFRKTVYPLSMAKRTTKCTVDNKKARDTAMEIHTTYTQYRGTDTPRFDFIGFCCCESFQQMKATFEAYAEITGESITNLIQEEFHGNAASALKAAVKCAFSVPGYLAERLYKSMEGISINRDTLIRIIVSRSEIDLGYIKNEFEERYQKTIESKIRHEMKGPSKHLLLAILKGNRSDNGF